MTSSRSAQLSNGLKVIHANRMEDLRDLVVGLLRSHPLAPLQNEVFLVQSNGIGQWLKLAIAADDAPSGSPQGLPYPLEEDPEEDAFADSFAGGCGIAAAMEFLLPSRFLWQVYRAVLGEEAVPVASPLDKERLTWRLMRLLPEVCGATPFQPLQRFLDGPQAERRLFQLAMQVADQFDQYQVYRADWLSDWAAGRDVIRDARGQTTALDPGSLWQPALWRHLLADLGASGGKPVDHSSSRAAIHRAFMAKVSGRGGQPSLFAPTGIPPRVIVFGVSSLPQQTLEALQAIARWSQVILCVHNPCEYYWADIIEDRDLLRAQYRRGRLKPGLPVAPSALEIQTHANPLLAAWGKQGRDYMRLLDAVDEPTGYRSEFSRIDLFSERDGGCLLHQIQDDIRQLRPLTESRQHWPVIDPRHDRSLTFTCAHSPQREVEILHDQLLDAFNADPTLKPRDVVVMVPDITVYAPCIEAVFGRVGEGDRRHIPFTVADQGDRHREPLLIGLEKLLGLPESRLTAADVLDLLDLPLLRERFGLAAADLPILRRWIAGANIRWGLHGDHRASLDLPAGLTRHTWQFGLRRMLLGYSVGEGASWQGIEPFDEVGGLEAASAGGLYLLLEALEDTLQRLIQPRSPALWATEVRDLLERFFVMSGASTLLLLRRLEGSLEDWLESCVEAHFAESLPLTVVREVILERLEERSLSQRFLVGKVNFATLLPMRAIPFRLVCLLGMNDGDYPRSRQEADFNLMRNDYRPGDRSRREDDRYLFLEALLSARDRLIISWVGRSVRDNSPRPPSVLVSQLLDHLDAMAPDGRPLARHLVTEHPLQPFSLRYFQAGAEASGLFTYAREWRQAHDPGSSGRVATVGEVATPWTSTSSPGSAPQPLPVWLPTEPLTLAVLSAFLKRPAAAFFQRRLRVRLEQRNTALDNDEPFLLDNLQTWTLQDALIKDAVLAAPGPAELGVAVERQLRAMEQRGDLGCGPLVTRTRRHLEQPLADLYRQQRQWLEQFPLPRPDAVLRETFVTPFGTLVLEDRVDGIRTDPEGANPVRVVVTASAIDPEKRGSTCRQLLEPWVRHVAAASQRVPLTTVVIGTRGRATLPPLAAEQALAMLGEWLNAFAEGLQAPLPVAPELAFEGLPRFTGDAVDEKLESTLRRKYAGDGFQEGLVDRDPYLRRAFPDFQAFWQPTTFWRVSGCLYQRLLDEADLADHDQPTGLGVAGQAATGQPGPVPSGGFHHGSLQPGALQPASAQPADGPGRKGRKSPGTPARTPGGKR